MFLEHLELTQFRNYFSLDRDFISHRVLLLGANAQGKTNLLEAIGALATASSPFTPRDKDLVRWGEPQAIVRSLVRTGIGKIEVDLLFRVAGRRAVKVNGIHQRRISDLLGTVNAVVFSRGDLDLVSGIPAQRRAFLNQYLLQIQPHFHEESRRYSRVLAQRNHALCAVAEGRYPIRDLEVWDTALVRLGGAIHRRRQDQLEELNPVAAAWHLRLSGDRERLELVYRSGTALLRGRDDWELAMADTILKFRSTEIARRQTMVGPHRDDFEVLLDGRQARVFASTGQRRTIVLALKLAEMELLRNKSGESPLLLLDDVLAELDSGRQNRLLAYVPEGSQTFVTSTHLSDFSPEWIVQAEILEVNGGKISTRYGHY